MKTQIFLFLLMISVPGLSQGVKVGTSAGNPDASSILEAESTTQGFLPPRMTTQQRDAIVNPAEGLQIYNTSTKCTNFYIGTNWQEICGSCTPQMSPPSAAVHVTSETEIEWNWNTVGGADGYKYNTSNNYATATDNGPLTSYTQTGLSVATPYTIYVWAYNVCGESANSTTLTTSTDDPPCMVGLIGPGGGRIFYCGNAYPGFLGLEAAPSDQSTGAQWGCSFTTISGADGTAVGTGIQNTTDILNGCGTAGIAARICDDLDLNGFNDWFLPSKDELFLMYNDLHLNGLGGFGGEYWSSTEATSQFAWIQNFNGAGAYYNSKQDPGYKVRAVRKF